MCGAQAHSDQVRGSALCTITQLQVTHRAPLFPTRHPAAGVTCAEELQSMYGHLSACFVARRQLSRRYFSILIWAGSPPACGLLHTGPTGPADVHLCACTRLFVWNVRSSFFLSCVQCVATWAYLATQWRQDRAVGRTWHAAMSRDSPRYVRTPHVAASKDCARRS